MVKYKSLLEKYCCNSVDGIATNNTMFNSAKNMAEESLPEKSSKSEDQYVPPWRAACDAWVTDNVLDSPGDNTPVYQLYNAYINDNPDDYMDIGQFGKVLRSRFPYRKRRRGKQGQQVYVYQDVALKKKPAATQAPGRLQRKSIDASLQNPSSPAGPAIVVGNNSGGRLLTSPNISEEESAIKRSGLEGSLQLSPSLKRLKVSKDTGILGLSNNTLRFKSSLSPYSDWRQPVATMEQSKLNWFNGENTKDNWNNKRSEKLNEIRSNISPRQPDGIQWTKVKNFENSSKPTNYTKFDKVVKDIVTTNISEMLQCDVDLYGKSTLRNGCRTKQNLIFDVALFKQKGDETNTIGVSSGSVKQRTNDVNLHSKYEASNATTEDEKYANASLCRMAIGRRWIDTNLTDMPGVHTTAEDICNAYTRDHPDEPLTFTSLALLIRGKYPGRRKKINVGSEIKYIYQDIKLTRCSEGKSMENKAQTSNQQSGNLQCQSNTFKLGPSKERENLLQPNYYVLVPANSLPTFNPLKSKLVSGASNVNVQGLKTSLTFAQKSNSSVKPRTNRKLNAFGIESLFTENNDRPKLSESKNIENAGIYTGVPVQDDQEAMENSGESDYEIHKHSGMEVSDYIEGELLAINEMNTNEQNYSVSIKIPSGNQFTTWRSSRELNSPNPFAMPDDDTAGKGDETTAAGTKYTKSFYPGNVGINYDMSLDHSEQAFISKKVRKNQTRSSYTKKRRSPKTVNEKSELEVENPVCIGAANECLSINQLGSSQTFFNLANYNLNDVNEKSNYTSISKNSSGSPTSTSPPCPAMHRLAEEIDAYTPSVGGSSHPVSPQFLPSSTRFHEEKTENQLSNVNDPEYRKTFRSVIISVKQIISKQGASTETNIERNLEKAIIENNPAVLYSETAQFNESTSDSNSNHLPCVASSNLKDLMTSHPGRINDLLEHHQSCPGLGCSTECQTLRAAFIHITIFRHKCQVWKTFNKVISKHSKQCRLVSCGVEFCQFVKHELHQCGVSVLPMQLLKERPTLEEEFKKCEEYGTHDGELHCHHMRYPLLPSKNSGMKRRKESEQSVTDVTMDTNFILPDTPNGNALAVHFMKTIELVKSLFQIPAKPN